MKIKHLTLLCVFFFVSCGDDTEKETETKIMGCSEVTNVSDGPTADSISTGANQIACYYSQPSEGYCRLINDSATIQQFYDNAMDKAVIGCADAVVLTGVDCPTLNASAHCDNTSIEAERWYYTCTKFSVPADNCSAISGTYVEL